MKLLITFLVAIVSYTTSIAQQYFLSTTDFRDSINRRFEHEVEPLGVILLNGYLRGQLKAYSFHIAGRDVKWKPAAASEIPPAWDPGIEYYAGDKVAHGGRHYYAVFDIIKAGTVPPSVEWKEYEPYREAVSTIWSFPGAQDTISKSELLKNFIKDESLYMGDLWDPKYDYYTGDVVEFNGKFYQCAIDHGPSKRPDLFADIWMETGPRISFYRPRDLSIVEILYWRDTAGRLLPQTLSLNYIDEKVGITRNSGLNFYYPDVVEFLARQQQLPMLYQSDFGYAGAPQLLLGWDNSQLVMKLIRDNVSTSLKPSKRDILEAVKYDAFLLASEDALQSGEWSVVQDLTTNDLTLTVRDYNNDGVYNTPVAKIPWKAMEKLLKEKQPEARGWGYLEGLEAHAFNTRVDTLSWVDSLDAKFQKPSAAVRVSSARHFIDDRSANIKDNPAMGKAISTLWTILKQGVDEKKLVVQPRQPAYFRCDQPFPKFSLKTDDTTWEIDEGFVLESANPVEIDSAIALYPPGKVSIQYRRTVTSQKSKKPLFEPVKVSVGFFHPDQGLYYNYYFLWNDVVRSAADSTGLNELLTAIRTGKLNFDSAEYVYGLTEDY